MNNQPDQFISPSLFKNRKFVSLQLGRIVFYVGMQMQGVAVGWHVYSIRSSTLDLGLVGLSIFLPTFLFSVFGGDLADRYSRSRLAGLGFMGVFSASLALCLGTFLGWMSNQNVIFGILALMGLSKALGGPAGAAVLPQIVDKSSLQRAVSLQSSLWQFSTIAGPSLGGLIYGLTGKPDFVYALTTIMYLVGALLMFSIRTHRPVNHHNPSSQPAYLRMFERVADGLKFLRSKRELFAAMSLDLFAVLLGGCVALLPAFAKDVLNVGPDGLGILRSAPAIGAAFTGLALAWKPLKRGIGRKMFFGVAIFGLATCVFALSQSFWLSFAMLIVLGGSDMVNVVVRQSLIQMRTPDEKRGRISAVSQIFIGASNELGEFESGMTAHYFGLVPAALIGGVGTLAVCIFYWKVFPELRDCDTVEEQDSREPDILSKKAA